LLALQLPFLDSVFRLRDPDIGVNADIPRP